MTIADILAEVDIRLGTTVLLAAEKTTIIRQALRVYASEMPPVAYKTVAYGGASHVDLPADVGTVVHVYPNTSVSGVGSAEELLFGFTPVPQDMDEYFIRRSFLQTLRSVGSARFNWKQVGTKLFVEDAASDVTALTLVYYEKVDPEGDPDIAQVYAQRWLVKYATALVMQAEARRLRRTKMIGVTTDAAEMATDADNEIKACEKELADNQMPLPVTRYSGT